MVYHALKGFVLQLNGLLGPLGAHKWFTKAPRSHSKFNNECPDLFRFFSIFLQNQRLIEQVRKAKRYPKFSRFAVVVPAAFITLIISSPSMI